MDRLSIVIANYNYARYVAAAIESALAIDWPDVEIIVVDDGSTDQSAEVLKRYADRVTLLFGPNRGQREAVNRGFGHSTGDVVIFLDADDVLPPEIAAPLAEVMAPGVSKVQFRMQRIDEAGKPIGGPFPDWRPVPTPADVREWMTRTSAYPTPPGSGNAYARWFLEQVFPLDPVLGRAADSGCLAAAPFHGDVLTVPEVVVGYRRHGANDSDLLGDTSRFAREVEVARARWRFALRTVGVPENEIDERPLFRSRELLQLRVSAVCTSPTRTVLPHDSRGRMALDSLRSPFCPGPERWSTRLAIAFWCLGVLAARGPLLEYLIRLRWRR